MAAGGHHTATEAAGLKDRGSIATDLSPPSAGSGEPMAKATADGRAPRRSWLCRRVWLARASPHRHRARTYLWCKGGRSAKHTFSVRAAARSSDVGASVSNMAHYTVLAWALFGGTRVRSNITIFIARGLRLQPLSLIHSRERQRVLCSLGAGAPRARQRPGGPGAGRSPSTEAELYSFRVQRPRPILFYIVSQPLGFLWEPALQP